MKTTTVRSRLRSLALAVPLLGALAAPVEAQTVPQVLTVQGYLTDGAGAPVNTTGLTVQVTIYDDATANGDSNRLYQVLRRVDVVNGNFSVLLGRPAGSGVDPIIDSAVFNRPSLWVGVAVGADAEMSPRLRVTAVPFAVRAGTADNLQGRPPRSCPTGTVDMGHYCIDATSRNGLPQEALEACYGARGEICNTGQLFNACRRSRLSGVNQVAFTPVVDQWILNGHTEWYHPQDDGAVMGMMQFGSGNCLTRSSVAWAIPGRGGPIRYYCCSSPSPAVRGE